MEKKILFLVFFFSVSSTSAQSSLNWEEEDDWIEVFRETDKDILWCALSAEELDKCRRFSEAVKNDHEK